MERRQHPRYAANLPVQVTDIRGTGSVTLGRMLDISQEGVCVVLPLSITPKSVVRLNIAESIFYGYVAYCSAEGPQFRMGIAIEQVLLGGADLGGILQQVLLEQMPATPGVLASDAYLG